MYSLLEKGLKTTKRSQKNKKSFSILHEYGDDDDCWCLTPPSAIFKLYHGDQF